jgi:two-component system response regulator NreC
VAESAQVGSEPIDIVLADDHAMVRAGLRLLLESERDFRVVAEAGDIDVALEATRTHRPAVVVLDLNMPGTRTLPAIPRFLEASPAASVVVLTMTEDPAFAREAIAAGRLPRHRPGARSAGCAQADRREPRAGSDLPGPFRA